jgi:GAF domain-containing protein
MTVLQNLSDIVRQPVVTLVYQLFLLLVLAAALGMVSGEWRRTRREEMQRLLYCIVGLAAMRIIYLVGILVTRTSGLGPDSLLPPLERFVDTASIALLGWGFLPVARRATRVWGIFFGANLVLALGVVGAFAVLWYQALSTDPSLSYSTYWQATIWTAWQIGLALLFGVVVAREQQAGWGFLLAAAASMVVGQVMQVVFPSQATVAHTPFWERLANLVAYSLILVAVYQRILAGLRVHSRQLQDVTQASLDQIKSLLFLFEAGQRMYSSLEPSVVFDNAARGVAQALDADQCAIVVPSESDPSQMRLVAVHNPMRQGRASRTSSFPLEYQLVIQQAMRRKSHIIVEGDDSMQLRALFGLLGSSQTGPLLVQPLLGEQDVVGAIIVGNAQSRRPFGPNDAKLCQFMARQTVLAIQNSRRHRKTQEKMSLMRASQNESRRTSLRTQAQVEEMGERLTGTQMELESLRQARDDLETKLASSRAEADTLTRRLAALEHRGEYLQDPSADDEVQRMQVERVAAMAEEFTVPLSTILSYTDLLLSETGGGARDAQRKILLRIKASAERVVEMAQEMVTEVNGEPGQPVPGDAIRTGASRDDDGQVPDNSAARHPPVAVADITGSES